MSTVEYGMEYREYGMGYGVLCSKKKKKKKEKQKPRISPPHFHRDSIFSPPRNSRLDRQVPKGPTTSEASGGFLDGECQKNLPGGYVSGKKGKQQKSKLRLATDQPDCQERALDVRTGRNTIGWRRVVEGWDTSKKRRRPPELGWIYNSGVGNYQGGFIIPRVTVFGRTHLSLKGGLRPWSDAG